MREVDILRHLEGGLEVGPTQIILKSSLADAAEPLHATLEWRWGETSRHLGAEIKTADSPLQVERALAMLHAHRERLAPERGVVFVAPHIREEILRRCLEERICAVDLCGNAALFDGAERWLWISGRPKTFKTSRPIRNIFAGGSSLVGRALLAAPEHASLTALMESLEDGGGSLALSTISRVIKALCEELLVAHDKRGVRLLQPDRLLARLAASWHAQPKLKRIKAKWTAPLAARAELRCGPSAGAVWVFQGGRHPALEIIQQPADVLMVRDEAALRALPLGSSNRFPDVEVWIEAEAPAWFGLTEEASGVYVSALQLYLELSRGDARQQEMAAVMRPALLLPTGRSSSREVPP